MAPARTIDVQDFINAHKLSRIQITIVVLCFLIVAVDGFDTAAIGYIAPALRAQWGVTPAQMAPLFGAGLFGLMIGALIFGPVSDRFGRKPVLVFTTFAFGVATLVSAWATDVTSLTILRFLTGLGLGGAMPNAITLTSEYCPESRRSSLVTAMFCGFTVGSAFGGFAAAGLIANYGWQSVLILGGVLPILLTPIIWIMLPESVRFLVLKNAPSEQITAALHKIAPEADLSNATYTGVQKPAGSPVGQLFKPGLVTGTLLLWGGFFMSLLVFYLLTSWLPTLMRDAGLALSQASLVTAMLATGGTIGAIVLGRMMDRIDPHYVLAGSYILAAVFIGLIGYSTGSAWMLAAVVFGAGFCLPGAQVGINALAASYYPTASRATGVSWANAVGRIGSVLGSMIGGTLIALGLGMPTLFAIIAAPVIISGILLLIKSKVAPQPVHHSAVPASPSLAPSPGLAGAAQR
jgi:AAHS family 4-hydroxybenzoate transporter-like MFS transporter